MLRAVPAKNEPFPGSNLWAYWHRGHFEELWEAPYLQWDYTKLPISRVRACPTVWEQSECVGVDQASQQLRSRSTFLQDHESTWSHWQAVVEYWLAYQSKQKIDLLLTHRCIRRDGCKSKQPYREAEQSQWTKWSGWANLWSLPIDGKHTTTVAWYTSKQQGDACWLCDWSDSWRRDFQASITYISFNLRLIKYRVLIRRYHRPHRRAIKRLQAIAYHQSYSLFEQAQARLNRRKGHSLPISRSVLMVYLRLQVLHTPTHSQRLPRHSYTPLCPQASRITTPNLVQSQMHLHRRCRPIRCRHLFPIRGRLQHPGRTCGRHLAKRFQ